ncbi:hypothetical protein B1C78_09985 [Thioalkalivibrio denitrificans]|uniref:Uncharacterized protein n=1 Tax=Thioalkalivibrio denitrificans TaxID=108003 RepID=A0A1V3NFK2_9GAMM|nr:hypothetical protein [Thioalkalivibrio denitrificans]OOG23851.1 hypothetical protein B1C78_09985 [Thioalkalivibrio denitrificans]
MSLSFRITTRNASEARDQAAQLAWAAAQEPMQVSAEGDEVVIDVHHPLAVLLAGTARLVCCGFGRASRLLCPERADDCKPHGV